MALNTPTSAAVVVARMKADIKTALALFNGDPFLRNSWLGALTTASGNRQFDFYFALDEAALEALPDTAEETLERWAAVFGIIRTAGTKTTGSIVATGTATSTIPLATLFTAGDGAEYESTAASTVTALTGVAITTITRVTTVATVTTTAPHGLASNVKVSITGANESEYNVTLATITVTGASTFTYVMSADPGGSATGTPVGAWTIATVLVESVAFGDELDQAADAAFQFQSPVVGVDDAAHADQTGLTGGADQETDAALRVRLLERIRNPVAHFNVADIETTAKAIAGVTRVFVEEVTPAVGQVTIYFMRDNDAGSAIPNAAELLEVKTAILLIKPANTPDSDVIVSAPSPQAEAYTFSSITPDTTEMRTAVTASLTAFFDETPQVGVNVDEDAYRSAIFASVDLSSGAQLTSFALSTPSGDLVIASGEIATLGTVTYP